MNKILPFILTTIFTILFSFNANALTLTKIGNYTVGQQLTEYFLPDTNPSFEGTTVAPNTNVLVNIEGVVYNTISDSSGVWTANVISPSDSYLVNISEGELEYSFTMNVNSTTTNLQLDTTPTATTSNTTQTTAAVPETGMNQFSSLLFSAGILLLAFYFYFWGSNNANNHKLEKYYIKN